MRIHQKKQIGFTDSLVLPPTMDKEEKATTEETMDAQTRYQPERR